MRFSRWFFVGLLLPISLAAPVRDASAMIAIGGGVYCTELYVMGQYQGLGNCYDFGGGGGTGYPEPPAPPSGGGGGTGTQPDGNIDPTDPSPPTAEDLLDRDVSARLKCAMKNFFHADIRLRGGRTMKRVNVYLYGKKTNGTWGYEPRTAKVPPGPDWQLIDGATQPNASYGRLYKSAYEGRYVDITGTLPTGAQKRLVGQLTGFEAQLLVAAHEATHLLGTGASESVAEWYGIDAVEKYRAERGGECSKEDPPPK